MACRTPRMCMAYKWTYYNGTICAWVGGFFFLLRLSSIPFFIFLCSLAMTTLLRFIPVVWQTLLSSSSVFIESIDSILFFFSAFFNNGVNNILYCNIQMILVIWKSYLQLLLWKLHSCLLTFQWWNYVDEKSKPHKTKEFEHFR